MKIPKQNLSYLLKVYSEGKSTAKEEQELFTWMAENKEDDLIINHIEQLIASYNSKEEVPVVDWEQMYQRIVAEKKDINVRQVGNKILWYRWMAAAAILLLIGTGFYFFAENPKNKHESLSAIPNELNDIAPPNTSNAVLTLGNGQKIILDSSGNGVVARQGGVNVIKLADGGLAYRGAGKGVEYNTLNNPRGSKVISLALSDGSRVWLNAESSLRYPTSFVGNERKVEITGEAYFEIAPDLSKSFIVVKGNTNIQVLGTHFNVKAYEDEKSLNITLLEGKVRINSGENGKSVVITPGEQAQVNKNGSIDLSASVDITEVMAWKNGEFSFKGTEIENIMREVSRWYDVEIIFESPVKEKFYAEVSRNTVVSTLLQMLEATKAIHFKIEGRKIRVLPGAI